MKIKNLPKKIYLNICSNEDEVDYNELNGGNVQYRKDWCY